MQSQADQEPEITTRMTNNQALAPRSVTVKLTLSHAVATPFPVRCV